MTVLTPSSVARSAHRDGDWVFATFAERGGGRSQVLENGVCVDCR
jgi:hypothetical protein